MYKPRYAENTDVKSIREFVKQNGFGIIVSQSNQKLMASHIPLEFAPDESKLLGHVSRANPQWKSFDDGSEVLTIFSGPHAYISSSWYDHENVPTWNYIAVHIHGRIRIIEGAELLDSLKQLVNKYEASSRQPVSVEGMSKQFVQQSLKGLVGFEILITNIEASYKLSQNRDKKNQMAIIAELEKRNDPSSVSVAAEMKKHFQIWDGADK
jgi:transcriptional regulator